MKDASVRSGGTSDRTSSSLLVRIKAKDEEAWRWFVRLYSPLVHRWCGQFGLQAEDVADVGQEVFRTVAESIDRFHHDRSGDSFRGWLRTITRTRCLDFLRRDQRTATGIGGSDAHAMWLELPQSPDAPAVSDEEDKSLLIWRTLDMVLDQCNEESRRAFLRVVIGGEDPAHVAHDLGLTANAVYIAKSRILKKIRDALTLIEDP